MTTANFPENLRRALASFKSISAFCRQVGINRQQINKYLNGMTMPSDYNMQRMARALGVTNKELLLNHDDFQNLMRTNEEFGSSRQDLIDLPDRLRSAFTQPDPGLKRYAGLYQCYIRSESWRGYVLCYAMHIVQRRLWYTTRSVGHFSDPGTRERYLMKSAGTITMRGEALFLIEEDMRAAGLSATILEPSGRSSGQLLRGITVDMPFNIGRRPIATQTVFRKLPNTADMRDVIARTGTFALDSTALDHSIRRLLLEPLSQ
jgi:transcriptional regulator with XRE-family HTH domain